MRGQPYPIGLLMFMIASVLLHSCGGTEAYYDVVVVGGGAGGTSAGIQSARSGASVLIVEETPWLGGMLTSAGVSAFDGNYRLRGGLFGEFCDLESGRLLDPSLDPAQLVEQILARYEALWRELTGVE